MLRRSLTILFLLIPVCIFSQADISGKLIEANEQTQIEFATVAIYTSADSTLVEGVLSDNQGEFLLKSIREGEYYLMIRFLGYENKIIDSILVSGNKTIRLGTIPLVPGQTLLDEIVISRERATTVHKADRQVYLADRFRSSEGGSATDILRNLPAVSVDSRGVITSRGSSGFVLLIDGKPVQTDPMLFLDQLPANAIESVELITAPSAKYDPEGKAGIINIVTQQKNGADGWFVQVNTKYGLPSIEDYDNPGKAPKYGADFTLNYRKEKWNISAGAAYLRNDITGLRIGDVYTIINDTLTRFPSDGERSFDEESFSGRFTVDYTLDERNRFSFGFYAGERSKDRTADILYYDNHAIYEGERLYTLQYFNENLRIRKGDFVLGSLDYEHSFRNNSRLSTSFLYEYTLLGGPTTNRNLGWPDLDFVYQDEYNTNDNPLYGIRFQTDYSMPISFGTLELGYQYRNLDHIGDFVYDRKNNETGEWELVPEFSSSVELIRIIHSGYAQLGGSLNKWDFSAGVRMEYMDRELMLSDKAGELDTTYLYDFIRPFPSASLQYNINEDLRLKAAYSKRIQRTTTFKMNPFPEREHSETLEQGDPRLLPEFIDLVEAGVVKDFGDNSVFATLYFRNVKNLVNRVNTIYNDSILNRIYSNVGTGKSAGIEIGAELNPFQWWKIYAGGNLYRYSIDGSFDGLPVNTSSTVFSVNINTGFDLPWDINLLWTLNYISDQVTAQGEDSRFYLPSLSLKKAFLDNRLALNLQWLNMDMGLLDTNEQRITTWREGEFYTTTNYIYEVDIIMINLSYTFRQTENKARFIKSEFGEKEF